MAGDDLGRAVVVLHGYGWQSPDLFEILPYADEGFTVLALDCRGQGGRSLDGAAATRNSQIGHPVRGVSEGPSALLYRSIFTDVVRAIHVVGRIPSVDPKRIGVAVGSQGGGLALAGAALEPSVAAVAAWMPALSDSRRIWEMHTEKGPYAELHEWLRRFDPQHERIEEFFGTLGHVDVQHLAPRIRGAVLMVTAMSDQICPPSTQFAAYNKIVSPKRVVTYPDYGHEALPDVKT